MARYIHQKAGKAIWNILIHSFWAHFGGGVGFEMGLGGI